MSRAKRHPLLVHIDNSTERKAVELVSNAKDRQGAAFLRALILLGFYDIKRLEGELDKEGTIKGED